jgi:hypothetical protein
MDHLPALLSSGLARGLRLRALPVCEMQAAEPMAAPRPAAAARIGLPPPRAVRGLAPGGCRRSHLACPGSSGCDRGRPLSAAFRHRTTDPILVRPDSDPAFAISPLCVVERRVAPGAFQLPISRRALRCRARAALGLVGGLRVVCDFLCDLRVARARASERRSLGDGARARRPERLEGGSRGGCPDVAGSVGIGLGPVARHHAAAVSGSLDGALLVDPAAVHLPDHLHPLLRERALVSKSSRPPSSAAA